MKMKIIFLIFSILCISFSLASSINRPSGVPSHFRLIEKEKGVSVWMNPEDMIGKECGKDHHGYMDITDYQNLGMKAVPTVRKKFYTEKKYI
jgi:hypothetical protein